MKCYDCNILTAYGLIGLKASQFPQGKSLKTVETCGSYATRALPPFINITSSISPAEHDINRKRVVWDRLLWNDSQRERTNDWKPKENTIQSGLNFTITFKSGEIKYRSCPADTQHDVTYVTKELCELEIVWLCEARRKKKLLFLLGFSLLTNSSRVLSLQT